MTEIQQRIGSLEAQIRVMTRAIATAKNSTRKAADVVTLATLQGELDRLKAQQQANNAAWDAIITNAEISAIKNENDAQPGTVEEVAGGEGEASDKTKQNE